MIESQPVSLIRPTWAMKSATRYVSHPDLRFALIQLEGETVVYCVTEQKLPESLQEAVEMITAWKVENAGT